MIAPINKIIDMSFVDGPGNRSVIFFQGCNFHCKYCHNPETINECIHCGICVPGCPTGALIMEEGKVLWDSNKCIDCGQCYHVCAHNATPRIHHWTPDDVIDRMKENLSFIRGITVSGGECSLQRDFIIEIFKKAKALGLSTLMDSNGGLPIARDSELMEVTDGVMLDVKASDSLFHEELVGYSNTIVLQNLVELAEIHKLVEIRTVVLKGSPYSKKTVKDVVKLIEPYLKDNDIIYKLIKFRPIGVQGEAIDWVTPSTNQMEELKKITDNKGFKKVLIT